LQVREFESGHGHFNILREELNVLNWSLLWPVSATDEPWFSYEL